jgi:hypothetical protein
VIQGRDKKSKSISVFEGMMDFLSLLVLQNTDLLEGDAIVMHSVTTYESDYSVHQGARIQAGFYFFG